MPERVKSCFELSIHFPIQLDLSTTATLGTEKSGRCGEVAVMGR